jgi:hypothetical protein
MAGTISVLIHIQKHYLNIAKMENGNKQKTGKINNKFNDRTDEK